MKQPSRFLHAWPNHLLPLLLRLRIMWAGTAPSLFHTEEIQARQAARKIGPRRAKNHHCKRDAVINYTPYIDRLRCLVMYSTYGTWRRLPPYRQLLMIPEVRHDPPPPFSVKLIRRRRHEMTWLLCNTA